MGIGSEFFRPLPRIPDHLATTKGADPERPVPDTRKRERAMPEVVVAKPREGKFNKNAARRVRVAGKIPAVLYGSGHDPVAVEVEPKQISRILFSETGHNTIFDVEIPGSLRPRR